jgi:membrane protease YdiL (CAAX protease family)
MLKKIGLFSRARLGERLVVPREPVHGIVRVLEQVGRFFAGEPVGGRGAAGHAGFSGRGVAADCFFLRQHQIGWREALGFRGPQLPRALLLAVLAVVIVILPVALGLQQVSAVVLTKLGWPPEDQTAVTLLAGAKSWGMRIYLGAFAVVLAPVAEEFIFRGMLYPFVKQLGWPRLAWFGVSFAVCVDP